MPMLTFPSPHAMSRSQLGLFTRSRKPKPSTENVDEKSLKMVAKPTSTPTLMRLRIIPQPLCMRFLPEPKQLHLRLTFWGQRGWEAQCLRMFTAYARVQAQHCFSGPKGLGLRFFGKGWAFWLRRLDVPSAFYPDYLPAAGAGSKPCKP